MATPRHAPPLSTPPTRTPLSPPLPATPHPTRRPVAPQDMPRLPWPPALLSHELAEEMVVAGVDKDTGEAREVGRRGVGGLLEHR
jgi:hypothetical protein